MLPFLGTRSFVENRSFGPVDALLGPSASERLACSAVDQRATSCSTTKT